MAILLTNGIYYITINKNGGILKVADIRKAKDFLTVEAAVDQKNRTPGKCRGYYHVDIDIDVSEANKSECKLSKRKKFSSETREKVYKKTEGHCYLCGDFVDYNSFEIEHKVPLSKGGTNDFENLFCSCHTCNMIKQDIYPEDFMERITKIFMYQIKIRGKDSFKWRFLHKTLEKNIQQIYKEKRYEQR